MCRSNIVIFDLDETLIYTFYRQYKVIESFFEIRQIKLNQNFESYLELRKEKKISNFDYFKMHLQDNKIEEDFRSYFLENIESVDFLKLDTLIVDINLLKGYKNKINAVFLILSLRTNEHNSKNQIEQLGLSSVIDNAIFLKHNKVLNPKIEALSILKKRYNVVCFIGDSLTDLNAANETNIPFIKVNTNIFDFEYSDKSYSTINDFLN